MALPRRHTAWSNQTSEPLPGNQLLGASVTRTAKVVSLAKHHGELVGAGPKQLLEDSDSLTTSTRTSCSSQDYSDCGHDLQWEQLSMASSAGEPEPSLLSREHPPVAGDVGTAERTRASGGEVVDGETDIADRDDHTLEHPIGIQASNENSWIQSTTEQSFSHQHHPETAEEEEEEEEEEQGRSKCTLEEGTTRTEEFSPLMAPGHPPTLHPMHWTAVDRPPRVVCPMPAPWSPPAAGPSTSSSPAYVARHGKPHGGGMASPLALTPVHLAALAFAARCSSPTPSSASSSASTAVGSPLSSSSSSSPSTPTSPVFAPRLHPVVRPIHIGPPTEYDFRNTNGLMKCLNALARLPSPEELSAKHLAIHELQRTVDAWMRETFAPEPAAAASATLLLGGSWHLKVGLADSDLDVVALLPSFVTAECFFTSLHAYLAARRPAIAKLVARTKAAVPILAFQLHGVRIDLLFARFTEPVVPKHLPIHSDHVLAGMDAASIRSLSVPRVASLLLELVPNDGAFRSCLRIVRLWAKRRGLYSNKAGFLGGISWTILVAFICQMFPKATISSVIHRFFSVLATWSWPTPVLLAKPYDCPDVAASAAPTDGSSSSSSNGGGGLQWCPQRNHHDRGHLMPIITPGFPAVNSSVNVNASTLRILKEEFERGKHIMDEMLAKSLSSPAVWHKLFTPSEFLVRYDHYVAVELVAPTDEALCEWANYVSSRTRKLVETLQHTPSIISIHPHPELVRPRKHDGKVADDVGGSEAATGYFFLGFTIASSPKSPASKSSNEDVALSAVASALRYFAATELDHCPERREGMFAEVSYSRWQELPDAVFAQGRTAAAGERARFILSRAHSNHVAWGLGR